MEKHHNRLLYNQTIVDKLQELIRKHPDLRFGQLLVCCDIIQYQKEVLIDGNRENILTIDPFNEESELIWKRMCNNSFCFGENILN